MDLPATVVYDHPSAAALAAHIAKLIAAQQPQPAAGALSVGAATAAAVEEIVPRQLAAGSSCRDGRFTSDIVGVACRYPGNVTGARTARCYNMFYRVLGHSDPQDI